MIDNKSDPTWWKNAVGYQIYPKSFFDSNNDGFGDIQGIIQKIPYIASLGVTFVWLSPFFKSPNVDNGYDVSDYQDIDSQYGTLNDVFEMIHKFHEQGIRVVFDLVINHTSDKHKWFQEAKKSVDNPYHDFYIWKKASDNQLPNNWQSLFGGPAWEFNPTTDEYYYHLFAKQQPDLNWENPKVHEAVSAIIKWWAEQGVDGFRLDAISHLKKNQKFVDVTNQEDAMNNVPGIDKILGDLSEDFKQNHLMTVGEAGGVPAEEAKRWVNSNGGYFDMIFQFDHVSFWEKFTVGKVDVAQLRKVLTNWQTTLEGVGWNALFLENHDLPRAISYFGNGTKYHEKSATALAMMYMMMKGTPFVYQGQELGMANVDFNNINQFDDLDSIRFYQEQLAEGVDEATVMNSLRAKSRDNARTPMQWSDDLNAGFSNSQPWLEVNENYPQVNVANEGSQTNSVLHFYKQLIQLRLTESELLEGKYQLIDTDDHQLFVYERVLNNEGYLIITNLSDNDSYFDIPSDLRDLQLVVSNNPEINASYGVELAPWDAVMVKFKK